MTANTRAGLFMVLAMSGFTINDALVKSLGGALPVTQVIAVRGALLTVMVAALVTARGLWPRRRELLHRAVALRTLGELGGTLAFLSALPLLPFANVAAILQSLPLVVTVGAIAVFGERVDAGRWLAILVGLGGVLLIVRPGAAGFEPASLLVVLTVLFAAGRDLATRALPPSSSSLLVTLATAVTVTLYGVAHATLADEWRAMTADETLRLALAAVLLFAGYLGIVRAMREGEVAAVVPYRYTGLLLATLIGILAFGERPDALTVCGALIVVATGLYTLGRGRAARRALPATGGVGPGR